MEHAMDEMSDFIANSVDGKVVLANAAKKGGPGTISSQWLMKVLIDSGVTITSREKTFGFISTAQRNGLVRSYRIGWRRGTVQTDAARKILQDFSLVPR
jgi:hypothetical protein